jgi:hypothetical protein
MSNLPRINFRDGLTRQRTTRSSDACTASGCARITRRSSARILKTAYLLEGEFKGEKAKAMEEKLKLIGLDLSIFPRNLQVLLDQRQ